MKTINVNEIFGPTVQGEGKNAGKACMFIRLSGCTLHCDWCDTPHTWNWIGTDFKHPEKFDPKEEVHPMTPQAIIDELERLQPRVGAPIKHLVVSGGEPMSQQKLLVPLYQYLKTHGWYIESETNGTVPPTDIILSLLNQVNCSPKLSHSGNSLKERIKEEALKILVASKKANFKLVVGKEEDEKEMMDIVSLLRSFGDPEIFVMPLCRTRKELKKNLPIAEKLAKNNGLLYTSRISIELSGDKRGI